MSLLRRIACIQLERKTLPEMLPCVFKSNPFSHVNRFVMCINTHSNHLYSRRMWPGMHSQPLNSPVARRPVLSPSEVETSESVSGLESSLINLINEYNNTSLGVREQTERAKKKASRTAIRVSDLLVEAVNGGVQEAFVNEKRIELEIRALSATIARFAKQTDQWLASSHSINTAIKEIGDFENWMKVMEFDCKSITAAISNIHNA